VAANALASAAGGLVLGLGITVGRGDAVLAFPLYGFIIGWAQWTVLRHRVALSSGWVWVTGMAMLGAAVLALAALVVGAGTADLGGERYSLFGRVWIGGALGGAVLGLGQWPFLRRIFPAAGLWVVASALGGALVPPAAFALWLWAPEAMLGGAALGVRQALDGVPVFAAAWTAASCLYGAVTGGMMVWLLSRRRAAENQA
jgi:hypothetical protein